MTETTVLVVEDERIIAKGLEKRLKGLGYGVAGFAASGNEAIAQACTMSPDIVLMDINLGNGIDGVEAAQRIREKVDIPVVFLTAFSDMATLQRAKLTQPHGYILKPYEDKDLQTAIEIGVYRHRMEREARENAQWLTATLGSIGDGVIATDGKGRVRFMNPLAERLTGWSQEEAAQRDIREVFQIIEEKSRGVVENPVLGAIETGEVLTLAPDTALIDRRGGEHPIDDSAAPIRDLNGKVFGAVLVFRDISERRRLEERLRQAQKMEAIGRLAGGIAHDFNNVMTVITGFSELLQSGDLTEDEHQDYVQQIHDAALRASALTRQIMAFSRKQVLAPRVIDLNGIVREMSGMIRRLIGSHIEFTTHLAASMDKVKVDPSQVSQILLNLAANARDAMPDTGRLILTTANAVIDEIRAAQFSEVKPGRYAMLTVADTGCGMPPEVLDHVFEPFFTTKEAGKGTGLGLATVFGIIKQSEGHIEVDSVVGSGTTFRIYLPQTDEEPEAGNGHEPLKSIRGRETILLVEDDDMVRQMTKMALERSGYKVYDAPNGEAGFEMAQLCRDRIDLLITDLVMPRTSGREVAERVKRLRPDIRVLYITGYTEDIVIRRGVELAAIDLLEKPFTPAALTRRVREILDRNKG